MLPKLKVLGRINKILIYYLAVEAGDNVILGWIIEVKEDLFTYTLI